jgi:hypothetical protein
MYIYNILPERIHIPISPGSSTSSSSQSLHYRSPSNYLLGYLYLKAASERYENNQAYYYLAVLEYMKLTPTILLRTNLKKIIKQLTDAQPDEQTTHAMQLEEMSVQWSDSYGSRQ